MIEVLVCDLGNVVLPFDFSGRPVAFDRHRRLGAPAGHELVPQLIRLHEELGLSHGGATAEQFFQEAAKRWNLDIPVDAFAAAWSDGFRDDPAVPTLVSRLRVVQKVLLTNTDPVHWEWILRNHASSLAPFDRLLTSFELRAVKPQPEIYRRVEEITGRPPASHLMVDDIAENVDGARACGWDGVVFTGVEALERELGQRGLKVEG